MTVEHYDDSRGGFVLRAENPLQDRFFSGDSVAARLARMVGSRAPGITAGWGKHYTDVFSLDGGTYGAFHFATSNGLQYLRDLHRLWPADVPDPPSNYDAAYGACKAGALRVALRAPWAVLRVQTSLWWADIVQGAEAECAAAGWQTSRGLAIAVRWTNSGGMPTLPVVGTLADELAAVESTIDRYKRDSPSGPHRRAIVRALFPAGELAGAPSVDDIPGMGGRTPGVVPWGVLAAGLGLWWLWPGRRRRG